jgi:hypothetical protein
MDKGNKNTKREIKKQRDGERGWGGKETEREREGE